MDSTVTTARPPIMRLTCEETGDVKQIVARVTPLGRGAEVRAQGRAVSLERRGCPDPTVDVKYLCSPEREWSAFRAHECGCLLRRGDRIRVIESGVTRTWVFDDGVSPIYGDGPLARGAAGVSPI